ncbi:YjgN family protein [Lentibacter sp. XHP0401]|jgi:uncharacterized membrane protein YjgN (DUF898 family)|uniref:YjgN family protein n=1 Tax=Lentibacter sp. XHP0401 TaxID=2984334 RepID=UPI0021E7AE04|nr:YjgN family protein [Lentibacter sp. XHP0401]MCV2894381.1 YjgN family protein [Lentibacter sp. XHP0401]
MSSPNDIQGQYRGTRGELFPLAIGVALLTLVTFGIYRFWGKTRIRKYIWSSTVGDGDAFEYTGTGLEKFLGFLVAIVALAIYLGIVQMLLFFAGLNYSFDPDTPQGMLALTGILYLNIFALVPLVFYAMYRARRYKMARTRWRGVRFGMEKGAWGFSARSIGYGLLTVLTLGALFPLANFKLEKYMADRSYFGDARFEQNGKWTALYGAAKHLFIGLAVLVGGVAIGGASQSESLMGIAGAVGYIWLMVGFVYYRVHAFRYMAANRTLGGEITFTATPTTGEVIKIYIIGTLVMGAVIAVFAAIGGALFAAMMSMAPMGNIGLVGVFAVVLYVIVLVLLGAMALVFITQPTIAHFITTFTVHNADALNDIRQRASETGVDAEGFADALDIGGAI